MLSDVLRSPAAPAAALLDDGEAIFRRNERVVPQLRDLFHNGCREGPQRHPGPVTTAAMRPQRSATTDVRATATQAAKSVWVSPTLRWSGPTERSNSVR
jgi:hypothetical protein